jgi:hypothetical protein
MIFSSSLLLAGCPGDSPGDTATSDASTAADDDDGTTAAQTSEPTTTVATSTGVETTESGVDSSSSSGPTLGCTPGDPCCNDAGEFEGCWIDDATGLVWELEPGGGNPTIVDALGYCDQLTLLDSGSWRLPTLDELRTLVRACPDTEASGACGLTDDCAAQDCRNDACDGCIDAAMEGPGMFGCYWDPNLLGNCDRYWSSTNTGTGLGWIVDFEDASVRQADAALPAGLVRCVAN